MAPWQLLKSREEQRRDQHAQVVQSHAQEVEKLKETLARIEAILADYVSRLAEIQRAPHQMADIRMYQESIRQMRAVERQARFRMARAEGDLIGLRRELTQLELSCRKYTKLWERELEIQRVSEEQQETRELDAMAMQGHYRRTR
jgi:membrane-bound lytic murein transglycosylase